MAQTDIEQEEPLDPKLEDIRRRMMRRMLISMGTMTIGLLALLFAIIYKINDDSDTAQQDAQRSVIPGNGNSEIIERPLSEALDVDIPEGSNIMSSSLSGNRLLLEIRLQDRSTQLWIVNMISGEVESRVSVK